MYEHQCQETVTFANAEVAITSSIVCAANPFYIFTYYHLLLSGVSPLLHHLSLSPFLFLSLFPHLPMSLLPSVSSFLPYVSLCLSLSLSLSLSVSFTLLLSFSSFLPHVSLPRYSDLSESLFL